eukprot:458980_1
MAHASEPSGAVLSNHLVSLLKVNDNGWSVALFQDQKAINASLCRNCKAVCCDAVTLGCNHEDGDIVLFCDSCLNELISNNDNTCPINQHLDPNFVLDKVPNNDTLACYILKDWNKDLTLF